MSNRTCDVDGCVKPHRARGLCSTHYNQFIAGESKRHPKVIKACTICGTRVRRSPGERYLTTCSVRCRSTLQGSPDSKIRYDWAKDAAARAVRNGARVIEIFDRTEIFERDGWTCQDCGIRCTEPDPFVLTAATVDHVIPYAKQGEHSRANAQTLCLSCNSRKSDRLPLAS